MIRGGKHPEYAIFEYAYIDGSNYKTFGEVWLSGRITPDQRSCLVAKLESSQFFVAEQISIPPLCEELLKLSSGPTTDDHGWHSFVALRNQSKCQRPVEQKVWGSVEKFLATFRNITKWQPSLSANFESCEAV